MTKNERGKDATIRLGGLFKEYQWNKVKSLDVEIEDMDDILPVSCLFRRALDAEMKCGTRDGLHIKFKKDEKEFVSEEEEEMFWKQGLLGTCTAKSLLNTVYFYNGKLFGLRGGEHRNIVVNIFEIGSNFLTFTENASKTFHGGLRDLKYE
ncbi:hypothetical protein QZH41_014569 [Actinostola sp. cb2023]|nr:hypothetical protein QZH41_014569 [Actinostola sp. cb2023]